MKNPEEKMINWLPIVRQRTLISPSAPFFLKTGTWATPTDSFTKIPRSSNVMVPGSITFGG